MEFQFNVNEYFKRPIVEIGNTLLPPDFVGDRRALWNTVNKVAEIVNEMGEASAHAQGLSKPITTAERMRQSDQNLYLLVEHDANNGNGAITGMLKIGKKGLYVFDRDGQHFQVTPPCVLDFYVHEKRQRSGLGKKLFEYMLEKENVKPHNLAIDRPSEKFLNFLHKHYYLQNPINQMNNYVVFDGFFPESQRKESIEISPMSRTNGLQTSQSPNNQPLYGRYGAPRPPCSMGQIIHNTTAQKNSEPASLDNFKSSPYHMDYQIPPQELRGNDLYNAQYSEIQHQQQNNINEEQEMPQYENQYTGRNIIQVDRNNISNREQYNYQNNVPLNQFHESPNPQMQQLGHQQPYSKDQIRMFPEKETFSRNLTQLDNSQSHAAQNVGRVWPTQIEPQQVYQVSQDPSNMPNNHQCQQKSQTYIANQQYNKQVDQASVFQDGYSMSPNIQQNVIPQPYQTENRMLHPSMYPVPQQEINQQQHVLPVKYMVPYHPQQAHGTQPAIPESPGPDVARPPLETIESVQREMQSERQAANDVYSVHPNVNLSPSANRQTAVPTYSNAIGNLTQQYISPKVHQEGPLSTIESVQREMPSERQAANAVYSVHPNVNLSPSANRQTSVPTYSNAIGNLSQQYISPQVHQEGPHPQYILRQHEEIPQYQQQMPEYNQPAPVELNPQAIDYSHVPYQTLTREQSPRYMNNNQMYAPHRSAPNVTNRVGHQAPIQSSYSSQQFPPHQEQHRLDSREYQYVQSRPREQQSQAKAHGQKNQLKSETVCSLLQVDPKYFKPDPIRLNRPMNTLTRCHTGRHSKEDTVASLFNAEQEFFENGILRDKYRIPSRPRYIARNPLVTQEEKDGYPRQIEKTQQDRYIPQSPMHLHSAPLPSHAAPTIPQESYRENDVQVDENQRHWEQCHDHPMIQQQVVPINQHQVEQKVDPSGQFGDQQLKEQHDQSMIQQLDPKGQFANQQPHDEQHYLIASKSHPEDEKPYNQFRSDAIDLGRVTQQTITQNPQIQLPQQHEIIAQSQNLKREGQYESQTQDHIQQAGTAAQPYENRSEERQLRAIGERNDAAPLISNRGQPKELPSQYPSKVVEPVERVAENTRECQETKTDVVVNEMGSPDTIRQGSYIANVFNPHPEVLAKVSTHTIVKPSDEEISTRRKDVNRQYGLNEVDMRKKGYKSAIVKRPTHFQEIDTLEFGYPPQISKKRPPPRTILTMRGR